MMFIDDIISWAQTNGYGAMYGNPAHVNEFMTDCDYASATDATAVYCYLVTDSETVDGHDRATVAVYFSRLCDFDFDPSGLLTVQEDLKSIGKAMLHDFDSGNSISYDASAVRWQYGYDDFADNVAWVAMRVTFESLAADCWERDTDFYHPVLLDSTAGNEFLTYFSYSNITEYCEKFVTGEMNNKAALIYVGIVTDYQLTVDTSMVSLDHAQDIGLSCTQINDNDLAVMPSLADYKGKWITVLWAELTGNHTETVKISIPKIDTEIECDITW